MFIASDGKKHGSGKQEGTESQEKVIRANGNVNSLGGEGAGQGGEWAGGGMGRGGNGQGGNGQGGGMGRGSSVPLQPPALACQTRICLTKSFFCS